MPLLSRERNTHSSSFPTDLELFGKSAVCCPTIFIVFGDSSLNRFSVVETVLKNRLLCISMPPLKSTAVNKSRLDIFISVSSLYLRGEGIYRSIGML